MLTAQRFGVPYPYEIVRMLTARPGASADFPPGTFVEYDLDADGHLGPVDREPGLNTANVVVGLLTNHTAKVPGGDDPGRAAQRPDPRAGQPRRAGVPPDPRRARPGRADAGAGRVVRGVLGRADRHGQRHREHGLDRRPCSAALIEFTQRGGEVNIVVTGINVGGQPYWNAEATMLMHTEGILVMTPTSAMVLTGKQALDFSGGVSAEDNFGIGGYDRVMGPNGQAQYWAADPRGRVPHPVAALRPHATWSRVSASRGAPPTRRPGRPRRAHARRTLR